MTVTGGLVLSGAGGAEDPACAYVVVLGAGVNGTQPLPSLEERLEAALAYLQTYPEAQCVVSGGQGGGENITEALCMYTWLTDRGIPPERIWQEEQASSTQENLRFSLELIQEKTGSRPRSWRWFPVSTTCTVPPAWPGGGGGMPGRPRSDLPSGFAATLWIPGDFWRLVFPAVWQITTWKENMTWISNTQAMLPSKRRRFWGRQPHRLYRPGGSLGFGGFPGPGF